MPMNPRRGICLHIYGVTDKPNDEGSGYVRLADRLGDRMLWAFPVFASQARL